MSETLTSYKFGSIGASEAIIYGNNWIAQLFTVEKAQVESVILWIWTDGSLGGGDTGIVTVNIRAVSGGHPGSILSTATVNFADLPTVTQDGNLTDGTTVTLSSVLELAIGQYAVEVHYTEGDASTHIHWLLSDSGTYGDGNEETSVNAGVDWTTEAAKDLCFSVEGVFYPVKPTIVSPSDTGTGVALSSTDLDWAAGGHTTYYDVYFGTPGNLVLLDITTTPTTILAIASGVMDYGVTYNWRVDARNALATATGDVWSFTTLVFDPPVASGPNGMAIIKRLIAAAGNKFWYEDI